MKKTCADSLVEIELNILDESVKLCAKNFRVTTRRNIDVEGVSAFFEDVFTYHELKNAFVLHLNDYYTMDIQKNSVVFRNLKIDPELEVLNFYNKISFAADVRHKFEIATYQKTNNPLIDIYKRIQIFINTATVYKSSLCFKSGLELQNIYDVYAGLMAYSSLACCGGDGLLFMEKVKLIINIYKLTNVAPEYIKEIFELFTYNRNQKLDIIHTPLFSVVDVAGIDCYLTPASLLLSSNVERNMQVLLKEKMQVSIADGNEERLMIQTIQNYLNGYESLLTRSNVNLYKEGIRSERLTDIDLAVFDSQNDVLLCCEIKNFIYADSINQHLNIQGRKPNEQLNKGYEQIKTIQDFSVQNPKLFLEILNRYFDNALTDKTKISFCIISNHNLGFYRKYNIDIIEQDNFVETLNRSNGNLSELCRMIDNGELYNNLHGKYTVDSKKMEFAGYKTEYPYYYILNPSEKGFIRK